MSWTKTQTCRWAEKSNWLLEWIQLQCQFSTRSDDVNCIGNPVTWCIYKDIIAKEEFNWIKWFCIRSLHRLMYSLIHSIGTARLKICIHFTCFLFLIHQNNFTLTRSRTGFSSKGGGWIPRLEERNRRWFILPWYTEKHNISHDGADSAEIGKTLFCWWVLLLEFVRFSI